MYVIFPPPPQIHTPHLLRLQQRSWLIHWSLFVFFNHAKGQDDIIELLLYKPE
jgi:translation initiation factor 3 subunit E